MPRTRTNRRRGNGTAARRGLGRAERPAEGAAPAGGRGAIGAIIGARRGWTSGVLATFSQLLIPDYLGIRVCVIEIAARA